MAEMLLLNPVKKRRKKSKTKVKRRKKSALSAVTKRRSTTKRYRKNPIRRRKKGLGGIVGETIIPSAIAAGGAIGLDMMMAYLPVPDNLKTGPVKHLVKGAGAIGMGMLAGMFLKPKTAELITTGALTVVLHNAGKEAIQNFAPDIKLSGMDDDYYDDLSYVSPGMPVGEYLGEYEDDNGMNGMNAYLDGISLEEELEL